MTAKDTRGTIERIEGEPFACPYLPGLTACHEEYFAPYAPADLLIPALEAGFRHFGPFYFRPNCTGAAGWCGRCLPMRVDAAAFRPHAGQRRVLRRNTDVKVQGQRPRATPEKYALYCKHKSRFPDHAATVPEQERDQSHTNADEGMFFRILYEPGPSAWELSYWIEETLVGAGIIDVASEAVSSVYFYFDPVFERRSLGTFSILSELALARELGIRWYYLGYTMEANRSLRYKLSYYPSEYFDGRAWQPLRAADGTCPAPIADLRTEPSQPLLPEEH